MFLNFSQYILEELRLSHDIDKKKHYLTAIDMRIKYLKLAKLVDDSGKVISLSNSDKSTIERFFQETLSASADPNNSVIFRDTDVDPMNYGIVGLPNPYVILKDGRKVIPQFRVPGHNGVGTFIGSYFWLFTHASVASTVKVLNLNLIDGLQDIDLLKREHLDFAETNKASELSKFMKYNNTNDPLDVVKVIKNKLDITLDLSFDMTDQLNSYIDLVTVKEEEEIPYVLNKDDMEEFESIPKQMNISSKFWFLDYNAKFEKWGAYHINDVILTKNLNNSNIIKLKVDPKHVYWFEGKTDLYSMPKDVDIELAPSDHIHLAKQTSSGTWVKYSGTIEAIAIDKRNNNTDPFIIVDEWKTEILDSNIYDLSAIFKSKTNESICNFDKYLKLNS